MSKAFFLLQSYSGCFFLSNRNPDTAEKHHRPGSCLVDTDGPQDETDKAFSRPLLAGSHSYFHFYVNEEDHGQGKTTTEDKRVGKCTGAGAQLGTCSRLRGISSTVMNDMEEEPEETGGNQLLKGLIEDGTADRECAFLSHFNIPNFVNLEHSSILGDDDLYEPSVILEPQSHSQDAHCGTR